MEMVQYTMSTNQLAPVQLNNMKNILLLFLGIILLGCSDPRADDKEYVLNYFLAISVPSAIEEMYDGKITPRELAECVTDEVSNQLDDDVSWALFLDSVKFDEGKISENELQEKYLIFLEEDEFEKIMDKVMQAAVLAEVNCNPLKQ